MRSSSRLLTFSIALFCASLAACSSGPSIITPRGSGDVPGAASRVRHRTDPPVFVSDPSRDAVKELPPGCEAARCVATLVDFVAAPKGIALDASGNLFIASSQIDSIVEVPRDCASVKCVTLLGHLDRPGFVTVDEDGSVFATDSTYWVKEIPARCRPNCTWNIGPFVTTAGIAVDGSGNVFFANPGDKVVEKLPPTCKSAKCAIAIRGGFHDPVGVAVDASGNLFVADHEVNTVKKIPHGCFEASCAVTLGGGFSRPTNVAVDKHGDVFVTEFYAAKVKVVPPGCEAASCVGQIGLGFREPFGIAIAPADHAMHKGYMQQR